MRRVNALLVAILMVLSGTDALASAEKDRRIQQLEAELARLKRSMETEVVCRRTDLGRGSPSVDRNERSVTRYLDALVPSTVSPVFKADEVGMPGARPLFYLVDVNGCSFRAGDRIVSVNGVPLSDTERVSSELLYRNEWRFRVTNESYTTTAPTPTPKPVATSGAPAAILKDQAFELGRALDTSEKIAMLAPYLFGGREKGFFVFQVSGSGIAKQIGLKDGDILLSVNDEPLRHHDGKERLTREWRSKGTILFKVEREGREYTLTPIADRGRVQRVTP